MDTSPLLDVRPFTVSGALPPAFEVSYLAYLAIMASADFCILTIRITPHDAVFPHFLSSFLFRISQKGGTLPVCVGMFGNRNPTGDFTGSGFILHGIQISPDKNVNFPCVAAPFTVSPVPWASTCCAALPGDSALYDVSVRQLASSESPASLTCTPASFRPHLAVTPLPSASNFVTFHNVTGTLTGDLNPMSSRPCRAYTKRCKNRQARRFFEVHHFCQCRR